MKRIVRLLMIAPLAAFLILFLQNGAANAAEGEFANACERLFELGLPDPQGGEYRELEIRSNGLTGGTGTVKIHGWLLSGGTKDGRRYGLGWNGIRYPLVAVGEPADLAADVRAALKADIEQRAEMKKLNPEVPFSRYTPVLPHSYSASPTLLLPLKAAFLLRLGEPELAAEVWANYSIGLTLADGRERSAGDPFLLLAADWTWALFDAAVTAHIHGDDADSLEFVQTLAPLAERIEQEAAARGFQRPYSESEKNPRYLGFLRPLAALLADEERRVARKDKRPLNIAEILKISDKDARIAALVENLDEVLAYQWSQPGGVSLTEDATVGALVAEGEAAVEPLLRALETDARLTRSVSYHRNFFPGRYLIPVGDAAYTALVHILKTDAFGPPAAKPDATPAEVRRETAARIRRYYERFKGQTREERWFATLADDRATAPEWTQAAANIIAPQGKWDVPPAWVFASAAVPSLRKAQGVVLQGEPLRGKSAPSVAGLFVRRIRELAARPAGNWPYENLAAATNLGLALLAWEGRANIAGIIALQTAIKKALAENTSTQPENAAALRGMLVSLYLKRCEADDAAAFAEYADWITALSPTRAEETTIYAKEPMDLFKPLWRYRTHPAMIAAAKRLFAAPDSAWLPLVDGADRNSFYRASLLGSPLINVKVFRELALAGLADRTKIGRLGPRPGAAGELFEMKVENTFGALIAGSSNATVAQFRREPDDARSATGAETLELRVCDAYAVALTGLEKAPAFRVNWTEAERDRAIEEFKNFLADDQKRFDDWSNSY